MSSRPLLSLTRKINIVIAWERIRIPGREVILSYCKNTDVKSYISLQVINAKMGKKGVNIKEE